MNLVGYALATNEGQITSRWNPTVRYVLIVEEELVPLRRYLEDALVNEALLRQLMGDLCRGLDGIHSFRCCHRDLRIGNIYYRPQDHFFVIADLGVTSMENTGTGTTFRPDSIGSLAPELYNPSLLKGWRGSPPFSSDLYSLGKLVEFLSRTYHVHLSNQLRQLTADLTVYNWKKRPYQSATQLQKTLSNLDGKTGLRRLCCGTRFSMPSGRRTRPRPAACWKARASPGSPFINISGCCRVSQWICCSKPWPGLPWSIFSLMPPSPALFPSPPCCSRLVPASFYLLLWPCKRAVTPSSTKTPGICIPQLLSFHSSEKMK